MNDAASYAPVTILVDERPDGVHLVAADLDAKIEALLAAAAQ